MNATCMCYRQIIGATIIEAIDACPQCKPKLDAARAELAPRVTRTTRRAPRMTRDA
jgi:queuine/archaeosine tRNA-ribosyltransferase